MLNKSLFLFIDRLGESKLNLLGVDLLNYLLGDLDFLDLGLITA